MSVDSMYVSIDMGHCQAGNVEVDPLVQSGEAHIAFDHIYARSANNNAENTESSVNLDNGLSDAKQVKYTSSECCVDREALKKNNQILKELILLNLDMIQQQNIIILKKDRSTTLLQKQYLDLKVKLMTLEEQQLCGNCNQLLKQNDQSNPEFISKYPDMPIDVNGTAFDCDLRGNTQMTNNGSRFSESNRKSSRGTALDRRRDNLTKENDPNFNRRSRDGRFSSYHNDTETDECFSERSFKVNRKSRMIQTYGKSKNNVSYLFSDNEVVLQPSSPEGEQDSIYFRNNVDSFAQPLSASLSRNTYQKRKASWDQRSELSVKSQDRLFSPERDDSSDDSEMIRIMNWNTQYSQKRPRIETCRDFSYGENINLPPAEHYEQSNSDDDRDSPHSSTLQSKRSARIEVRKSYKLKGCRRIASPVHIVERQRAKSCSTSPFSNSTKSKRDVVGSNSLSVRLDVELRKSEEPNDLNLSTIRRRTKSLCTPPSEKNLHAASKSKRRRKKSSKVRKLVTPVPHQPMTVQKPLYTPQGDAGASWYFGLDPTVENCFNKNIEGAATPPRDADEEVVVAIPSWRINQLSPIYEDEGTEDLDDRVFLKRHQKYENEEKRVKKYDIRMAREQRRLEKLKRRHRDTNESTSVDSRISYLPQPQQDMQFVQLTDELPVNAFGENIIKLPTEQFDLPWRKNPKMAHRAKSKKRHR